jgi:hypothetical protein
MCKYDELIVMEKRGRRLITFSEIAYKLKPKKYWDLLGWIWTDSEGYIMYEQRKLWNYLVQQHPNYRNNFMKASEKKILDKLPNKITIYRGCELPKHKNGCSWTLDRYKAEWFANRWGKADGVIYEKSITKDKVFAFKNGRKEEEIVINGFIKFLK